MAEASVISEADEIRELALEREMQEQEAYEAAEEAHEAAKDQEQD